MKRHIMNQAWIAMALAFVVVETFFPGNIYAQTKLKNPLVMPAPGHITAGYSWKDGTHGKCDTVAKIKSDGTILLDDTYGDIYSNGHGGYIVMKYDGKNTVALDCVSAPKVAPWQSWEKFPPIGSGKGGKVDPSKAAR